MLDHATEQHAYAGQYSVRDKATGQLIAGQTGFTGGATIRKPRLYDTPEAAEEAATAVDWADCEAVRLVADEVPRRIDDREPTKYDDDDYTDDEYGN